MPVGAVTRAVGSVMADVEVVVQPLASVTVTVYVAAHKAAIVAVPPAFDHKYVYAAVPPKGVAVEDPVQTLLQATFVLAVVAVKDAAGWVIVGTYVTVHPLLSVMVTVYVAAQSPEMVAAGAPVLHK